MDLALKSNAFADGETIPAKYTCEGEDISPHLKWEKGPKKTRSYALLVDDPDAPMGTWVHWVMYNIPVDVQVLEEGLSHENILPNGANQGINDGKRIGYMGPCPPDGEHTYYFNIYALDTVIDPYANLTKDQLLKAMGGHIIAKGRLRGKYSANKDERS